MNDGAPGVPARRFPFAPSRLVAYPLSVTLSDIGKVPWESYVGTSRPRLSSRAQLGRLLHGSGRSLRVILSVVIITHNEEANIGRTLASVQPLVADGKGEIIVVDSGSTDRTVEIAKSFGAKVFVEEWKGYAAQKNSAIDKAAGDWILSLDADEEVEQILRRTESHEHQRGNPAQLAGTGV